MCGSPLSSNIADVMSLHLKPSFRHRLSHMNLEFMPSSRTGNEAQLFLFSRPCPRPCHSTGMTRTPACLPTLSAPPPFFFSANLLHSSQSPVQLHLQIFGLLTPSSPRLSRTSRREPHQPTATVSSHDDEKIDKHLVLLHRAGQEGSERGHLQTGHGPASTSASVG